VPFCSEKPVPQKTFPMKGILINTNTVEAFRTYNKMELIQSIGQQVVLQWEITGRRYVLCMTVSYYPCQSHKSGFGTK